MVSVKQPVSLRFCIILVVNIVLLISFTLRLSQYESKKFLRADSTASSSLNLSDVAQNSTRQPSLQDNDTTSDGAYFGKNDVLKKMHEQVEQETETTHQNDTQVIHADKILSEVISNYRSAYPFGTDPEDPDPTIYINSRSDIQPNKDQWFAEGQVAFKDCPNLQPWMTCSYTSVQSDDVTNRSHAVLFHARHMFTSGHYKRFHGLPKVRHPDQKWVFYESEAPTNVWNYANVTAPYWNLFNLTATFTSDSDMPVQYHKVVCQPKQNWTATGKNYASKSSLIAWFVSHCSTSSKRELYVEELTKYVPVDIYGDCGNNTVCKESTPSESKDQCMNKFLSDNYKFYLSFENAFCEQYVTEKFNRNLQAVDIVPVVLGSADYANILPEGSYINVADYQSPKALADYLKHLDQNDDLYNQYIENKKAFSCHGVSHFPCVLCEYLHHHRHERQLVYDAASFWSVEQRCTSPKDYYRGVADEIISRIKFTKMPELFL